MMKNIQVPNAFKKPVSAKKDNNQTGRMIFSFERRDQLFQNFHISPPDKRKNNSYYSVRKQNAENFEGSSCLYGKFLSKKNSTN